MSLYASWIHGNAVQIERKNAPGVKDKNSVKNSFDVYNGDWVKLGGYAAVACLRIGWAARFVIFDNGSGNNPQSGSFWCHYTFPTPVYAATGNRAKAERVLLNYESTDIQSITPRQIDVWDGNRKIFHDESPDISGDNYDGGIAGAGSVWDAHTHVDAIRLWKGDIGNREIYYGLVVSILINAHASRDQYLEIRGVGIDFQV